MARGWEWLRRRTGDAGGAARRAPRPRPAQPSPSPSPRIRPAPPTPAPPGSASAADAGAPEHDPTLVAPVSRRRIAAALRRRGYRFLVDESGDLCGLWSYRFFSFYLVRDQVLQVRGRWSRQASIERLWEILAFTDTWNRERHHPKVYVRVHDDGRVHVLTEVSVPITAGLSDDQLDHHLALGLASGALVFDELDTLYPDPVLHGEPS